MFTLVVGQVVAALDGPRALVDLAVGPLDALALGPVRLYESRMPSVEVVPALSMSVKAVRCGIASTVS